MPPSLSVSISMKVNLAKDPMQSHSLHYLNTEYRQLKLNYTFFFFFWTTPFIYASLPGIVSQCCGRFLHQPSRSAFLRSDSLEFGPCHYPWGASHDKRGNVLGDERERVWGVASLLDVPGKVRRREHDSPLAHGSCGGELGIVCTLCVYS